MASSDGVEKLVQPHRNGTQFNGDSTDSRAFGLDPLLVFVL